MYIHVRQMFVYRCCLTILALLFSSSLNGTNGIDNSLCIWEGILLREYLRLFLCCLHMYYLYCSEAISKQGYNVE